MFTETPEAQAIIAWHDSQTEEFLASLPGYEDGLTPRQAWEAFCSLPATKQPGEGLAAPADAGQGAGTLASLLLAALCKAGLHLSVEAVVLPAGCDGLGDNRSDLLVHRLASALREVSQPGNCVLPVLAGDALQLHADHVRGDCDGSDIYVAHSSGLQMGQLLHHAERCYGKVFGCVVGHPDSLA